MNKYLSIDLNRLHVTYTNIHQYISTFFTLKVFYSNNFYLLQQKVKEGQV